MANKVNNQEELRQEALENISSTEKFFSENKKTITICTVVVLVVALAAIAYSNFVYRPACQEAVDQAYPAEQSFAAGEYQLALEGDGTVLGFADICSTYGAKAGKSVYLYAAVCAYRTGDNEAALSYAKKYCTSDKLLAARALALQGDCLVNLEQPQKAIKCFKKAAAKADNNFAAEYLFKAALVYESLGQNAEALALCEKIRDQYSQSIEGYEIEKYIERLK